ncbi:MAG: DUF294 nucleotidyltransferase-like domain-containing protein [Marinomonas sp.]
MSAIDVQEVVKFLQGTVPFDSLAEPDLRRLVEALEVIYIRQKQSMSLGSQAPNVLPLNDLHIIRRGAFEIQCKKGGLVDKLADGECFGVSSVLDNNPEGLYVVALEDSLVFRLDKESFLALTKANTDFALFFANTRVKRLSLLSKSLQQDNGSQASIESSQHQLESHQVSSLTEFVQSELACNKEDDRQAQNRADPAMQLSLPVHKIMSRQLVKAEADTSIRMAALQMTGARVSSLLIVEGETLIGIITDRDLRSRVLAKGVSTDLPVSSIMTRKPTYLDESSLCIHAQLIMSERNIHHLPIVDDALKPVGILTATDVLKNQQTSPLLMVSEINRQKSVAALAEVCQRLPRLIINLVAGDINPADMGEVLASITDNLTRRLIELAVSELGVPPMQFNFLVFGSQARKEQSLGSDQDNGIMLEREGDDREMEYFKHLSEFVCQGLNECGIPLCPGNIMSSNPDCRLTKSQWLKKIAYWVQSNSPQALLNASIFFDMRSIYGPEESLQELTDLLQEKAVKNSIFMATLTKNAISSRPPLGFFRDFVLEHSGEHKNKLDLKHQGLALINDLARLYSFATSKYQVSTLKRLDWIAKEGLLSQDYVSNLQDAWEYLSGLRLEAQQVSWQKTGSASAFLDPSSLSPLERKHLKLTFKTILQAQDVAQNKFAKGLG